MVFSIDLSKYRVIDLSYQVVPGENAGDIGIFDRPFAVQKGLLADQTFFYEVLKTHTHVGSHVEVASHYFADGKTLSDYPLEAFYGRAVLLSVRREGAYPAITVDYVEKEIGAIIRPGDIVLVRDDSNDHLTKAQLGRDGFKGAPHFVRDVGLWFVQKKVKMLALDFIRFGTTIAEGREFHDILMSQDIVFVEILANLKAVTKKEFFFLSLPYSVKGIDSGWVRAIAIEEK